MRRRRTFTPAAVAIAFLLNTQTARAERLPAGVVPSHYDLGFAVDLARARFEGIETIRVEIAQPTRTVVLHALDIAFRTVTITAAGTAPQTASVTLNEPLQTATLTVKAGQL